MIFSVTKSLSINLLIKRLLISCKTCINLSDHRFNFHELHRMTTFMDGTQNSGHCALGVSFDASNPKKCLFNRN